MNYQEAQAKLRLMQAELKAAIEGTEHGSKTVELDGSTGRLAHLDALQQRHRPTERSCGRG